MIVEDHFDGGCDDGDDDDEREQPGDCGVGAVGVWRFSFERCHGAYGDEGTEKVGGAVGGAGSGDIPEI